MKLDLTSLYFNGETESLGNTSSWGTALGQERPDYPISVEGGQEIVDQIKLNHVDFNPLDNSSHSANIKNLNEKKIIDSGKFDSVFVNNIEFPGPFFLLVIEETSGMHIGRKNLKYNNKIKIGEDSNENFYNKISDYFGKESCWFVHDISIINGKLHMALIKVDDKPVLYKDAKERKDHWESLISDFKEIKIIFKSYLLDIHKLKNESTANEYVRALLKIEKWFKDNNLCSSNYQIFNIRNDNSSINSKLEIEYKDAWKILNQEERGWYGTPWNRWIEFIDWYNSNIIPKKGILSRFNPIEFSDFCRLSGLFYESNLVHRFLASLLTKPFVILTGLSGSGKTKLAQAFVQWICQDESQYRIIPVGADWTNREPLLGYPNALKPEEYVKPDSGVLDLILQANEQPALPYFLILDEMNLSHVERYFADFLSAMESKEEIPLHAEGMVQNGVPSKLKVPSNLFIIGTVNIDETTNMFSPKVLDRANTIEFRVTQDEMGKFLKNIKNIDLDVLIGKGAPMAENFLELARTKEFVSVENTSVNDTLIQFFGELKKTGAEFGFRSATEILRLINQLSVLDSNLTTNQKIDIAIVQKLLPKLHGSRRKLCPVLETLGSFCIKGEMKVIKDVFEKDEVDYNGEDVLYPLSLEKIARMYRGAIDNGFASFAEA